MRASVGRAELARLVADLPPEQDSRIAALLGFEEVRQECEQPRPLPVGSRSEPLSAELPRAASGTAPVPFWRIEEMTFTEEDAPTQEGVPLPSEEGTAAELRGLARSLFATPPAPPLAPWPRLWPALRRALQADVAGRAPDVPALVRALGRGEVVRRIPRLVRRSWAPRASVWVDCSFRLIPFWSDQVDVCRRLIRACGSGVTVRVLKPLTQARAMARGEDLLLGFRPGPGTPVLVLGDLGTYGSPLERAAWLRTARRLRRAGVHVAALVPSPLARLEPRAARVWAALPWERGKQRGEVALRAEPGFWAERAECLLRLIAPAGLVQPGLLRALRRLLPAWEADAATEADVWRHADVRAADATGLVLYTEALKAWRERFAKEVAPDLKAKVSEAIGHWHRDLPRELLWGETLVWIALAPETKPPSELDEARAFARRLAEIVRRPGAEEGLAADVLRYGRTLLGTVPLSVPLYDTVPELGVVWVAAFSNMDERGVAVPQHFDPSVHYRQLEPAGEPRWWAVRQVGSRVVFKPSPSGAWPSREEGPGSPVAWLQAARPCVLVRHDGAANETMFPLKEGQAVPLHPGKGVVLRTDHCQVTLGVWRRDPWAVAAGRDRFGLWADAQVKGVVQRFRWVPPGRFRMGSPENEAGRWSGEKQHWVTWTKGRWLADTPVTQALWEAVMGNNPSRFKSPDRPVENVSWEDCQRFLKRLNEQLPRLEARPPTEAEWEHACRAGTEAATWAGDLKILGENNAPLLDSIAWYGGNCGVDFELPKGEGVNTSDWPEKQHPHTEGGTHPVGRKPPNPLELHDMLGNVFEWCEDGDNESYPESTTNPPARKGSNRVVRGGAWFSLAGSVRAAFRSAGRPDLRNDDMGFRLALGQPPGSGVESGARSDPASPGTGRSRRETRRRRSK